MSEIFLPRVSQGRDNFDMIRARLRRSADAAAHLAVMNLSARDIMAIAKSDNNWNSEVMGNRIADIGTMKSKVDADNRKRMFAIKKTARLGTEKNPAVVSVPTEARFKEVTAIFEAHGWNYRIGLEPEKPEDISDLNRLLNPLKPTLAEKKVGRNEPCPCGSGKKSKNCCGR